MPSVSKKQHNLMAMVANDPAAAKRVGIPQSVGAEFTQADKGMKFGKGSSHSRPDLQKVNKPDTRHGKTELFSKGGKTTVKHEESKMATKKMAKGGIAASPMGKVRTAAPSRDGIAQKGKTKGRQIVMAGNKMCGGGMARGKK